MNLKQAINRGFNLLAISFISLTGIAFIAEIFMENDWADKADDIGLVIFAIIGVVWYLTKDHKYLRSALPAVLVSLGLLDKIAGLIIERKDKDAVGDDIGGLILFVFAAGLVIYQYFKTGKLLKAAETV